MKSPTELALKLSQQWHNAELREQRLLQPESWPIRLSIGKPSARAITENLDDVRRHLEQWRNVSVGKVDWQPQRFRSASDAVNVPVIWTLGSPSEWIAATNNREIRAEYQALSLLASRVDEQFRRLVIRKRRLVLDKPEAEVIRSAELAQRLAPGCAEGKPLRALPIAGIDSKFFERNRTLIIQLLDIRFDAQVTDLGLEAFLGAEDEGHHWLLVVDLDGDLLPYSQLRVRANELQNTALPGQSVLIVENEQCLHQLPPLANTIAVLGAGLNLSWMQAAWLAGKRLAYWGDIDTWGLTMLARARQFQAGLVALLMNKTIFDSCSAGRAVAEPQTAEGFPETGLTEEEQQLYGDLLTLEHGRLEQEFLPVETVRQAIMDWFQNDIVDHGDHS